MMGKGEEKCTQIELDVSHHVPGQPPASKYIGFSRLLLLWRVRSSMGFGGLTFLSFTLDDQMGLVHLCKCTSF